MTASTSSMRWGSPVSSLVRSRTSDHLPTGPGAVVPGTPEGLPMGLGAVVPGTSEGLPTWPDAVVRGASEGLPTGPGALVPGSRRRLAENLVQHRPFLRAAGPAAKGELAGAALDRHVGQVTD